MNRCLWALAILGGFCLAACSPTTPVVVTHTRVSQTAVVVTATASQTPPPALPISGTPTFIAPPAIPAVVEQEATATATATQTSVPSPTAVTTLLTPIQRLAVGATLPLNHDLLFISAGALKVWQPQTGQVNTLLARTDLVVSGWRAAPDRQMVLIAQTAGEDKPGFTLSLFTADTRQVRELWSEPDHYLLAYALAANGRDAALITRSTLLGTNEDPEVIQVIDGETGQITTLADCPYTRPFGDDTDNFYIDHCHSLVAAPDGLTWLWRDSEGVWQGGLGQAPRLLVPHEYFDNDPPRIYTPTDDWSPDGRYQLLLARRFEGRNRWLLDMTTGQNIEVPNSHVELGQVVSYWQWTPDNQLFTVRPPRYEAGETDHFAELWHIAAGQLMPDAALPLPHPEQIPPAAASQLPDGRFAYIINHTDPATAVSRNLYLIHTFDQPPQPLVSLPPLRDHWSYTHSQSLTWTPDASGVLYILRSAESDQPFYIPAVGAALYDLTDLLGDNLTDLIWLP